MKAVHYAQRSQRNRPGYALLILLIVVAIGLILYFADLSALFPKPDPDSSEELVPWEEWRIRQASPRAAEQPSEQQVNIKKLLRYEATARLDGDPRGKLSLAIAPGGQVMGDWHGQYYNKAKVNFDIMSGHFEGYTCPKKIYRDENGEDPSKLYFITKGTFLFAETDFEKGSVHHRAGDIYVTGWIDPEYVGTGKITITSDERYSETFTWKAYRPID